MTDRVAAAALSPSVWIVDTSPFVGLAKLGWLSLLAAPTRQVWIVDQVEREVMAGPEDDAAKDALRQNWGALAQMGFVRVASPAAPPALAALRLGAGEEAVSALAVSRTDAVYGANPLNVTIIDDGEGRAAAKTLGVPVVGTVGVLLQARKEGRISEIAPVLRDLRDVGMFLPREVLLRGLLNSIGEGWP